MRVKVVVLSLLMALAGICSSQAYPQQDEDVRGAFMTTRPKPNAAPKPTPKVRHRAPRTATSPSVVMVDTGVTTSGTTHTGPRMGLGLTLFMRDSTGLAMRTDPSREFHRGDHLRVLLETNADGYLYVFNTTDNGPPVMIYPDPELDEAGNYIQAHVPFEIPSSAASEERLRWFTFDQKAGAEKLYFVFTRDPISGIPIEDDLVTFCRSDSSKCPWRPPAAIWVAMQKDLSETVKSAKQGRTAGAETPAEHQGVSRGIGLNSEDPEPSLIMLSASTSRSILIAPLDLVHK